VCPPLPDHPDFNQELFDQLVRDMVEASKESGDIVIAAASVHVDE
jgi:hypothetical protein